MDPKDIVPIAGTVAPKVDNKVAQLEARIVELERDLNGLKAHVNKQVELYNGHIQSLHMSR